MSKAKLPSFETIAAQLQTSGISMTSSELHGLLTGMLAGGLAEGDTRWQPLLFDYTNDGMAWPAAAQQEAKALLDFTRNELASTDMTFSMLLPQETDLIEYAEGVTDWTNHFLSGLGLIEAQVNKASSETREALTDLEEMGRLGIDEDDDFAEQAQLLEQVLDHIKVCALTVHAEFGQRPSSTNKSKTLH